MTSKAFEGSADRYGGITIDSEKEPCEPDEFLKQLSRKFTYNDVCSICILFYTNSTPRNSKF